MSDPVSIPSPDNEPLLSASRVAAVLRVSRTAVYEAVARGELPSIRIRGRVYVPCAALRRALGMDEGAQ